MNSTQFVKERRISYASETERVFWQGKPGPLSFPLLCSFKIFYIKLFVPDIYHYLNNATHPASAFYTVSQTHFVEQTVAQENNRKVLMFPKQMSDDWSQNLLFQCWARKTSYRPQWHFKLNGHFRQSWLVSCSGLFALFSH